MRLSCGMDTTQEAQVLIPIPSYYILSLSHKIYPTKLQIYAGYILSVIKSKQKTIVILFYDYYHSLR